MEFDKSKVYTALNADESLIGAKGYFADDLYDLEDKTMGIFTLKSINQYHFESDECDGHYNFFYLVEPAPEKWHVYKYDNKYHLVNDNTVMEVYEAETYEGNVFSGTKKECEDWINAHPLFVVCKPFGKAEFVGTKEECEKWTEEHSKKFRPFKDCDELIKCYLDICYKKHMSPNPNNFINEWIELPTIWVKSKVANVKRLITFIDDKGIGNNVAFFKYDYLFENYTFLDGSVCGVEE